MKINILFDTNYLFRKTLGIFAGYGPVDPAEIFSRKEDRSAFIRKVTTDMCSTLRSLPPASRIIMCTDSSSWRKEIEIEGGGYKSGRKKDENIDWSVFYKLMHEYCTKLEELGYIYTKINKAEADDLLYYWSRVSLKRNKNSIIISGDRDLHQLITLNENGNWVAVLNNNSKNLAFYIPPAWKDSQPELEVSIFNMSGTIDPVKSKLKEFTSSVENVRISSDTILYEKILSGDKGDSIPPAWIVVKGGKNHGITPKKVEDFLSEISKSRWADTPIHIAMKDHEYLDFLSGYFLRALGDVDSMDNRSRLIDLLKRNMKLVWLDKEQIPKEISFDILASISESIEKPSQSLPIDRDSILKNTDWGKDGYVPKKFDPFSL